MFEDITRRLIQGAGGEHLAAYDVSGRMIGRASDPEVMFQPSIPLTQLVVVGQERPLDSVADRIFRPILQTAITFRYPIWGTQHLKREVTARGPSGAYGQSDFEYTYREKSTKRHSWSAMADVEALQNADPSIGLSMKKARWGQRVVQLSLEYEVADLLLTTGSYAASHVLAIGAGSEWNDATPGDMLANVRGGMDQIMGATSLQYADLEAFISAGALKAALSNPAFITARGAANQGAGYPSIEDLGNYLGFGPGKLWTANPVGLAIGATTVAPLYTDSMVIYAPGDEGNYDREYGAHRFAVRWSPNDGVVGVPYYNGDISSWVWPFDRRWHLDIVNDNAGYLITNASV